VARSPEGIVLRRHRDFEGWSLDPWVRRGLLAAIAVIPILALANVFGQKPERQSAATGAAKLELSA